MNPCVVYVLQLFHIMHMGCVHLSSSLAKTTSTYKEEEQLPFLIIERMA